MAAAFDLGYFKRNPWALGLVAVVGAYIIYRYWFADSGDTGGAVYGGTDPAQAALYAQQMDVQGKLQGATIAANLQLESIYAQNSGQLALAKENNAAGIESTRIAAANASEQIKAQTEIGFRTIDAQLTSDIAARAVQMQTINASLETSLASIGASRDVSLAQTGANVQIAGFARDVSLAQTAATVKMAKIAQQGSIINTAIGAVTGGAINMFGASAFKG